MPKRSIEYLVRMFLILIVLTISGFMLMMLKTTGIELLSLTQYYFAQLMLFAFVGILLGFYDYFVYEIGKTGSWAIDVPKISILGIPIGLTACSYLIYWSISFSGTIHNIFTKIVSIDSGQVVAAQIILGYILITSFYKRNC